MAFKMKGHSLPGIKQKPGAPAMDVLLDDVSIGSGPDKQKIGEKQAYQNVMNRKKADKESTPDNNPSGDFDKKTVSYTEQDAKDFANKLNKQGKIDSKTYRDVMSGKIGGKNNPWTPKQAGYENKPVTQRDQAQSIG